MSFVSVIVCTRNRPDSLIRTLRSLLKCNGDPFELIVIDQSDGFATEQALDSFRADQRLRYVRSRAMGKGAALNEGLRLARGSVVVCTDDDCEVPPGWVSQMAGVMAVQPRAAVVFCNVTANHYDRSAGYVPVYERRTDRLLSAVSDIRHGLGLGAGMALRRDAVLTLGGFDETFGPGALFQSGDDWDISVRALLNGWQVYDTASTCVLHHGFRTLAEGKEHALRDWVAIGALCAKPIRARHLAVIAPSIWLFSTQALWPPLRDILNLRRPSGLSRIVGFARGFAKGICTPVSSRTLTFRVTP